MNRYDLIDGNMTESETGAWVTAQEALTAIGANQKLVADAQRQIDALRQQLADQEALTQEKANGEFAATKRNAELEACVAKMREQIRQVLPEPADDFKDRMIGALDEAVSKIRAM